MKSCSCGNRTFKCNVIIKASVIVMEKDGDPAHESLTEEIISSDYVGPYECTECGKTYFSLYEPKHTPGLHKKRCACGSTEFIGHQQVYHDVVVDSNNNYVSDIGSYESENPYGPYACINCGAVYDEFDKLDDIVECETTADSGISAKVDEISQLIRVLEIKKIELSNLKSKLPSDISKIELEITRKKKEYDAELENFIHLYMDKLYGIKDRHDANRAYLVFDEMARFVKVYRLKVDFEYTDDMEKVLLREKLSAHNASSFYSRNRTFYNLPLIEQLKTLDWKFDESGKLITIEKNKTGR